MGFAKITPTGFLPEDDQGALFVVAQLPGGSSVARTTDVVERAEAILTEEEAVEDVTSVIGLNFIDNYSQSNAAFMVVTLKPFEERKDRKSRRTRACCAGLSEKFRADSGRHGNTAATTANPRSRHRRRLYLCVAGPARRRSQGAGPGVARASRRRQPGPETQPRVQHVFGDQSLVFLDIDRDKAQILGVPLSGVFQALQASLGGYYVNNMNLFGRTWQVQVQAEAADRSSINDIYRINVRNNDGKMIPLRSLAEVRIVVGPPALIRYNNLRAVTVQGSPAAGVSSGQALQAMDAVAARTLPAGYAGEWTDTAFQEKRAEGKTAIILGFAICSPICSLVALYESWTIPVPVLLSVTIGIVGSFMAIVWRV